MADEPLSGNQAAFLHVALLRHLMVAPDQRDAIIERVRRIRNTSEAAAYMEEVRGHYRRFRDARKAARKGRGHPEPGQGKRRDGDPRAKGARGKPLR